MLGCRGRCGEVLGKGVEKCVGVGVDVGSVVGGV